MRGVSRSGSVSPLGCDAQLNKGCGLGHHDPNNQACACTSPTRHLAVSKPANIRSAICPCVCNVSFRGLAMGVIMQAFYWDCPQIEGKPFQWWRHLHGEVPRLAAAGFTALWLPPANKAASNTSMGYDPYDYYD